MVSINIFSYILVSMISRNYPQVISGQQICPTSTCDSSSLKVHIRFPFRSLNQPALCGLPGFDVVCNSTGHNVVLELPSPSGKFSVKSISYLSMEVELTDLDSCLPRKLLQFDVNALVENTPFRGEFYHRFSLYNCSSTSTSSSSSPVSSSYGVVKCLSGTNYTVVASSCSSHRSRYCELIGNVTYPTTSNWMIMSPDEFSRQESLHLKWLQNDYSSNHTHHRRLIMKRSGRADLEDIDSQMIFCNYSAPPPPPKDYFSYNYSAPPPPYNPYGDGKNNDVPLGAIFGAIIPFLLLFILIACGINCRRQRRESHGSTTADAANSTIQISNQNSSGGIDQQVINTYPTMVIDEAGQILLSMNDRTCAICLSKYKPLEVLKILPNCMHKFHEQCVDPWLRSKGQCPICRSLPPRR